MWLFTGIEDAHRRARADLNWENIPVVQGRFGARDLRWLDQRPVLPPKRGDGEVGGIFERDQLIGAFGATR